MKKIVTTNAILIFTSLSFSPLSWSQGLSTSSTSQKVSTHSDMQNNDWAIRLGYGSSSAEINHNESFSGIQPLGKKIEVSTQIFSIGMIKEFFNTSRLSLSAMAEFGIEDGSDKSSYKGTPYKENTKGQKIAAGVSGNYNAYSLGFKWQPYIATQLVRQSNESKLTYSLSNDHDIFNNSDITAMEHSLGLRIFDPSVQLMSFIAIDYLQVVAEEKKARAVVAGNSISAPLNDYVRNPVKISLGFGFIF